MLNGLVGLVLGMALPTWLVKMVLSIGRVSTALNRRIWCSDATGATRETIFGQRSGGSVSYHVELVCTKNGTTVRTISGWKMELTQWTVAAIIVLAILVVLIGALLVFKRLRRPKTRS